MIACRGDIGTGLGLLALRNTAIGITASQECRRDSWGSERYTRIYQGLHSWLARTQEKSHDKWLSRMNLGLRTLLEKAEINGSGIRQVMLPWLFRDPAVITRKEGRCATLHYTYDDASRGGVAADMNTAELIVTHVCHCLYTSHPHLYIIHS